MVTKNPRCNALASVVAIGRFVDKAVDLPQCNIAAPRQQRRISTAGIWRTPREAHPGCRFEPATRVRRIPPEVPIALSLFCVLRQS